MTRLPFRNEKKTAIDRIDYPLLTLAAIKDHNQLKFAFSGICSYPFRSQRIEQELNNESRSLQDSFENALSHLPSPIITDMHGTAEYRKFVLQHTLLGTIEKLLGE
jgi:CO/xanthine dehydrogenase FAD-binding subunit